MRRRGTLARRLVGAWLAAGAATCAGTSLAARAAAAAPDTVYVDTANPNCRSTAAGTLADPFCTVTRAITVHHAPGTVIVVRPGTYREQVTVPASGLAGQLITIQAAPGPGNPVVIEGADDFGSAGLWTPAGGGVWLAGGVGWSPGQVRAHGDRLMPWTGPVGTMPLDGWRYVAGTGLYVNVGADPATAAVQVGHRLYGFYLPNREYVHIEGFTILRSDDRGIQMNAGSEHVEIVGNVVRWIANVGIQATGTLDARIAGNTISECGDHGISLISGSTDCVVEGNESSWNAHPTQRRANGIYVFDSPANVISGNRWHHNQDSGQQVQSGSDGVISIQNVSWANGDHGFDHLFAADGIIVGDVAYANYNDGFSFEGAATGHQLHDCIAIENGPTTNEVDLWVDDDSISGFSSNDNIFWNSTPQAPIKQGSRRFASVSDWAAWSGCDSRSLQLEPLFVDPAGGDFHLRPGSPAIDNANSAVSGWPAADATGAPRVNDPRTQDLGLGPVIYADRGAYEFVPDPTTAVDPTSAGRARDGLLRIEPNPMRATADIRFRTTQAGAVRAELYDLGGRCVRTIRPGGPAAAGRQSLALDARGDDGRPLQAGVYFVRVHGPDGELSGRVLLLR